MPFSSNLRDMDLFIEEKTGELTKKEVEILKLKRNLKDERNRLCLGSASLSIFCMLGNDLGIPIIYLAIVIGFLLISGLYSYIKTAAETETNIVYLEAGLKLIRM